MNIFKSIYNKFVYGKGVFTFIRSSISSQLASWVDMGSGIGMVAMGVSEWIATPIGAILGGIVNCCINYKFTFRASDCPVKAVAVKYFMIWVGSVVLNTVGTSLLTQVLDNWHILEAMGFTTVGSFAVARVVVSLIVSLLWNFLLQKNFVYKRNERFDPYAIKFVDGMVRILYFKQPTTK